MDLQETLAFIHGIPRMSKKLGLANVQELLERMGSPHKRLRFVHVAGTNGKGSTCAMLANILRAAGYRTGLYISPYVLEFRERIQVDGEMISPEALARYATLARAHWKCMRELGRAPSEFELVVAIAMEYFLCRACDVVVLEAGMGGRLDATNVIDTPLCSVITSIGLDHMEYLGDTVEKIAAEKAGIIKPGGVTVCYPEQDPSALAVVMARCAEMENRLFIPNMAAVEVLSESIEGSRFRWDGCEHFIAMAGRHQILNALTALEAVKAINLSGFGIRQEHIAAGLAQTRFPARLEVLSREPLILLDGAHNLDGARALRKALELVRAPMHALVGMLADKDVDGALAAILPQCKSVIVSQPDNPRAMPAAALAEKARAYCADVRAEPDLRRAAQVLLAKCGGGDAALACGSLYLASDVRPVLRELSNQV